MQRALTSVPGVREVRVDFARKQAVVTADEAAYDEAALLQALQRAGFGGKVRG